MSIPQVPTREVAKTVLMVPTQLNYKKVTMKVVDGEIKQGGLFSSNFIVYSVVTKCLKWKATRKDAEFYILRKVLVKEFPHILIPPLPPKTGK